MNKHRNHSVLHFFFKDLQYSERLWSLDPNSSIYKNDCTKRTLRSLRVKDNREKKKVE